MRAVNDGDWTVTMGNFLSNHFDLYEGEHKHYKKMVHKLLGTTLKKSTHKKFVREKLAEMFTTLEW